MNLIKSNLFGGVYASCDVDAVRRELEGLARYFNVVGA